MSNIIRALYEARAFAPSSPRPSDDQVAALLRARGYTAHAAVLAFDRTYGGVLLGNGPDDDPHADDDQDLLGAYACLSTGGHDSPTDDEGRGLVPVLYTANDCICYLDGDGGAWFEDTIEGPGPERYARDGDMLVARRLLDGAMWRKHDGQLDVARACGAEIAAALSLPPIAEATADDARWWGDGTTLVVELGPSRTLAGSDSPAALDRWR
jgi:hypothetical protein